MSNKLIKKVSSKKYKIAVIGVGYVGLPLTLSFGKKFETIGYDKDANRINELKVYKDKTNEFSKKDILKANLVNFTNHIKDIAHCNIYIITLPTPIKKNKDPDLSFLKTASRDIANFISKKNLVIYESTVFPGCIENICIPILEKYSRLKINKDFYVGYSPERINPGDKKHQLENIVKITSGSNALALKIVDSLYSTIIKAGTFKTTSIKIAESAKVIENIQRDINIAFMNELKIIFDELNLNFQEILKAASSKWNFLNFHNGLVGGHCIGIDPYYLSYIAKKNNVNSKLILSGREINESMSEYYCKKIIQILKVKEIKNFNKNFLILGYSFKKNVLDCRNSKIFDIKDKLNKYGFKVDLYDPLVPQNDSNNIIPKKKNYDFILIAVNHDLFIKMGINSIRKFGKKKSLIFDLFDLFPTAKNIIRI